ncbi:MAG: hypothetical protein P4M11_02620 [Candidatus Pacebacteria bacterium]|nr:hypothetical protein [Candidatus Paceibacterota bacterium]
MVSAIPFDYALWAIGYQNTWLRCAQILKVYRLMDVLGVLRSQFKMFHLFNIVMLSFVYFISSHIFACFLYRIAVSEYDRGGRFDGRSFVLILSMFNTSVADKYQPVLHIVCPNN